MNLADLPHALRLEPREFDAEPQILIKVELKSSSTLFLLGFAFALILWLAIICSFYLRKVVVNVRLNENSALAPGVNEWHNMRLVVANCLRAFEIEPGLPPWFRGWLPYEFWLRLGFMLCRLGRLLVYLWRLIIAHHLDMSTLGSNNLLSLMLDSHAGWYPTFTLGLPHLSQLAHDLFILLLHIVHCLHHCSLLLLLLLLLSLQSLP